MREEVKEFVSVGSQAEDGCTERFDVRDRVDHARGGMSEGHFLQSQ